MDLTLDLIYYLIQTNLVNVVIIAFLYMFLLTSTTIEKRKKQIFLIGTVCVTILIFADATDFYLSKLDYPTTLRYITSAIGYCLRAAVIMFMLFISEKIPRKRCILISIPLIFNAFFAFCSLFTKVMFYFDENNQFHRGPLGLTPFIVCAFYMVLLIAWSVDMYRLGNRREASVVFLIAIMACLGVVLETGFKFKFVINGITSTSIVFYFLFLNTQTYKRDALTKALNRHAFYLDLESMSKRDVIIVSIDLNDLKKINDVQGHDMGDKAICAVTDVIFRYLEPGYRLYRVGGDEFIILCMKARVKIVGEMMKKVVSDIEKLGYQIAWGYAEYRPGMDIEEQMRKSDESMYINKAEMKK